MSNHSNTDTSFPYSPMSFWCLKRIFDVSVSYVFVLDTSLILVVDSVLYDIDLEISSVAKKRLWVLDVAKMQKFKSRGYLMSRISRVIFRFFLISCRSWQITRERSKVVKTFSILIEKFLATFDFSPNFCQNRHEIKKNESMIRDIRDIKYPRLLNFNNFATFSTRDF